LDALRSSRIVEKYKRLDKAGTKAWSKIVDHFKHPDYQMVLDGQRLQDAPKTNSKAK